MQILLYPSIEKWAALSERPTTNSSNEVRSSVKDILKKVRKNGDKALKKYADQLDGVELNELRVSGEEIQWAEQAVPDILKRAIKLAKENIEKFHAPQVLSSEVITTSEGVECWRKNVAIEKVGLYIPGGSAPLFSTVLMLGVPASIAGCKEIILCTPPSKDGSINPAILYTASLCGIQSIFKSGGAQAIAAMAYGTETIPAVNKIFGPGNQFVTTAKQLIQKDGIAIDMPAGPSEVLVIADENTDPAFAAADLLSQAEHGPDSQVILLTTQSEIAYKIKDEVFSQMALLPRKDISEKAIANSRIIVLKNMEEAFAFSNEYAPEHLIISLSNADEYANLVINAGSVFIGPYSPESAGDYASGTNHTLPTAGYAKAYSGVSVDSFVKKITFQRLDKSGLRNIGYSVMAMAEAEGLDAHKRAIDIRLKKIEKDN